MSPQDFRHLMVRRPFAPFDIVVADGSRYHVKHPDAIDLTISSVELIVPEPSVPTAPQDRIVVISLDHIMRLEQVVKRE